jgi:dihydropteroate synthase
MPSLVAILNLTPDSFSDGNSYPSEKSVLDAVDAMIDAGASVIDVGAESTRPGAFPLDANEEWDRLSPLIANIIKIAHAKHVLVSVDTRHALNASRVVALGADWINDISGDDNEILRVVAAAERSIVRMHHNGIPANPNANIAEDEDVCELIRRFVEKNIAQTEKYGIKRHQLILDPGIGFGKSSAQNWQILQEVERWHHRGAAWLLGHSRKSFLSYLTDKPAKERDVETLAVSAYAARKGFTYLRVHNVAIHTQFFRTLEALEV